MSSFIGWAKAEQDSPTRGLLFWSIWKFHTTQRCYSKTSGGSNKFCTVDEQNLCQDAFFWKLWNVQTETFSVNSWWMKPQHMTCCQVDLAKWIHTSSHATCLGRFFDVAFVGCCIICKHLPDDHGFAKCTCCGWEAPTYASGGHWFIKLELQWTILNAGRRLKSLQWSARRLGGMV